MIIGRNLVEEERLYSTGDYELDDLLEKAFCDGYEYAQREFGAAPKKLVSTGSRAMKNAQREAGRRAVAEKEIARMGSKPGDFAHNVVMSSKRNVRFLTNPSTMSNMTYARDMNLSGIDKLNTKITTSGKNYASSWSGVHGTKLGNIKGKWATF